MANAKAALSVIADKTLYIYPNEDACYNCDNFVRGHEYYGKCMLTERVKPNHEHCKKFVWREENT